MDNRPASESPDTMPSATSQHGRVPELKQEYATHSSPEPAQSEPPVHGPILAEEHLFVGMNDSVEPEDESEDESAAPTSAAPYPTPDRTNVLSGHPHKRRCVDSASPALHSQAGSPAPTGRTPSVTPAPALHSQAGSPTPASSAPSATPAPADGRRPGRAYEELMPVQVVSDALMDRYNGLPTAASDQAAGRHTKPSIVFVPPSFLERFLDDFDTTEACRHYFVKVYTGAQLPSRITDKYDIMAGNLHVEGDIFKATDGTAARTVVICSRATFCKRHGAKASGLNYQKEYDMEFGDGSARSVKGIPAFNTPGPTGASHGQWSYDLIGLFGARISV